MIVESGGLPDEPGSSLAPDALNTPECMPVADNTAAGAEAAVQQHGGQPVDVPKTAGTCTASDTPPAAQEGSTAAVHDELQDLLQ
jgi:hypothetical protein